MSWQKLPLRRRFKVVNGGTPTSDEENWGSEVSWATPADFPNQFTYLTETRRAITRKGATEGSTIVPEGSILLSTRAPIGYVALTPSKMAFNQGCRALVASGVVDSRYFGYQLSAMTEVLKSRGLGTTFLELSSGNLAELEVMVPPLEEQRRIADFLDAETARIDKMNTVIDRLRTVLDERRDAQRSRILRRLRDAGDRVSHPILGDLPARWEKVPLKRLVPRIGVGVVVEPSSYFREHGVPFLRGSNITDRGIDLTGVRFLSEKDSMVLWRSRLDSGDVVVVRAGYPGRAVVIPDDLDGANCASLLVIKRGKCLVPEYLEAYFNSPLGAAFVDLVRYGAAQEQINVSHVVNFIVPSPDLGEQKEIVSELDRAEQPVRALQEKLSAQRSLLVERRDALITAAVTGDIDVSTASGRGIEE